jgi:hypothetical protein
MKANTGNPSIERLRQEDLKFKPGQPGTGSRWLTPVILATQEAEEDQVRSQTPILEKKFKEYI